MPDPLVEAQQQEVVHPERCIQLSRLFLQRELADKAEASRFTELRSFLEAQHLKSHADLLARLDILESHLAARAEESDNTTAAYVGQLEQQLLGRPGTSVV